LKVLCVFRCVVALGSMAMAGSKNGMGIHDVNNVPFVAPVRVGTVLLAAGEYVVRHVIEQQDRIMVFKSVQGKDEVKVKCMLVRWGRKQTTTKRYTKSTPAMRRCSRN
jgi:hypothetical protein